MKKDSPNNNTKATITITINSIKPIQNKLGLLISFLYMSA